MAEQIRREIDIDAPADVVWNVILDLDAYPEWNRFTPFISLATKDVRVDAELDLHCQMTEHKLLRNEREVILALEPAKRSFCMGTSRRRGRPGIRSFRWQTCTPIDARRTHFVNYEEFHGLLAPAVYFLYRDDLGRAFDGYCADLKRRAESLAR